MSGDVKWITLKDPAAPELVEIVHLEAKRYPFEELVELLDWEREVKRAYEVSEKGGLTEGVRDGLKVVLESDFMRYCKEHAATISEPLWYAMITNLIGFRGGRDAIHELSKDYPRYSWNETERKIAHALRDAPGPHTVDYIEQHGFRCSDCLKEGVRSPAGLAAKYGPICAGLGLKFNSPFFLLFLPLAPPFPGPLFSFLPFQLLFSLLLSLLSFSLLPALLSYLVS